MTTKTTAANLEAASLRAKLFAMVNEFKDLASQISNSEAGDFDSRFEAGNQADAVACLLADVHGKISGSGPKYDLFIDAHRDDKDQSFAFQI
ncbi:hypothetical protein [Fimbriiglobus ruber]|uniref:Uncharacterized protein n=1 Tax=Fimbriiglobus ruber TaxID=1908690 RepID=A0A225DAB4_9BACT|nr:hypothetical protein [Fimbriiglobus ruber]OWK34236.1 hypothetical protein FRUB_10207 [Fimbriiglobus ruber]